MRALAVTFVLLFLGSGGRSTELKFHHVHYKVGDPSAAMAEAVRRFGGTREILQGLGVGVRIGDEYLLFDRADDTPTTMQSRFAEAYQAAQTWLNTRMLVLNKTDAPPLGAPDLPIDHVAFATYGEADFAGVTERLANHSRVVERRDGSVLFETKSGLRIEIVRDTNRPDIFWCPMHPDVRSPDAGKCSLCGMDLVEIPPLRIGEYKLDVVVDRSKSGVRGFRFTVREPGTMALVRDLAVVHEKRLHLFIVSRDLDYFAHVHPQQQPDGSFLLQHELPRGEYMLIADFLPQGGTSQMVQRAVLVGEPVAESAEADSTHRGVTSEAAIVDGARAALKVEEFQPGKYACLTFTLTDERTNRPITDLEPYLGAPAHMLLVRKDLSDVVHAHPEPVKTAGAVSFHVLVPAPGDYKLWLQVQRAGRVITMPFVLSTPRPGR